MSASENPEQKSAETPEERKERLKSLAKARVERLMADNADDVVRPHIDSTGRRDLAEASNNSGPVKSSTERLVDDGFLEISIRAHNVIVTKAEHTALPTAEVMHFKVDVDGVELDDPLMYVRSREFTVFSIKAPKYYTNMLLSDEIRNTYPLAVLRALIDNSWFASYLLTEVVERRNRALRI